MRHVTRFLTNKEYAETKRDAVLYRYLSILLPRHVKVRQFFHVMQYYWKNHMPGRMRRHKNTAVGCINLPLAVTRQYFVNETAIY